MGTRGASVAGTNPGRVEVSTKPDEEPGTDTAPGP